ncbi:hypothetical protein GFL69_23880 [Rhizobium leguminosarum bv. viciae]|nr:hypothetical protein [Rhizobium leguminosarum bv. viciae]
MQNAPPGVLQITKLKLMKRPMYRRGTLDLLQTGLIGATSENCTKSASEPIISANLSTLSTLKMVGR